MCIVYLTLSQSLTCNAFFSVVLDALFRSDFKKLPIIRLFSHIRYPPPKPRAPIITIFFMDDSSKISIPPRADETLLSSAFSFLHIFPDDDNDDDDDDDDDGDDDNNVL
jgi:hypothetical protein